MAAALIAIVASAAPAAAHARLVRIEPPDRGVLAPGPARIRLTFNGLVERHFARFELSAGAAEPRRLAWHPRAPGRTRVLEVALPPLGAGSYGFRWSVVSADGHRVEGTARFTVR